MTSSLKDRIEVVVQNLVALSHGGKKAPFTSLTHKNIFKLFEGCSLSAGLKCSISGCSHNEDLTLRHPFAESLNKA